MMKRLICLMIVVLITLIGCQSNSISDRLANGNQSDPESEITISNAEQSSEVDEMIDEEMILAEYQRFQQAMVDKDTDTLREMMGADTVVRHITGRTQTMDEWLSDVENEEMKYYNIEIKNPVISIDGDTATLSCSNVIEARIYGSHGTWTLSGGADFEKVDGEWKMSHS